MVARSLPLPNLSLRDALEALAALRAIHGVLLVYVRRCSVRLLFRFFMVITHLDVFLVVPPGTRCLGFLGRKWRWGTEAGKGRGKVFLVLLILLRRSARWL